MEDGQRHLDKLDSDAILCSWLRRSTGPSIEGRVNFVRDLPVWKNVDTDLERDQEQSRRRSTLPPRASPAARGLEPEGVRADHQQPRAELPLAVRRPTAVCRPRFLGAAAAVRRAATRLPLAVEDVGSSPMSDIKADHPLAA